MSLKTGRRILLPIWEELETEAKALVALLAIFEGGRAQTFNLLLGEDLLKGLTHGDRKTRNLMRDRIHAELRREFGGPVPFLFVLENSPRERLHLHGVVDINPNDVARLEAALTKAGGEWGHSRGQERQLHMKGMWGPEGWAEYICKELAGLPPATAKTLVVRSRPMTQAAVELYDQLREFADGEGANLPVTRVHFAYTLDDTGDADVLQELIDVLRSVMP
jgi:hypothetical protein